MDTTTVKTEIKTWEREFRAQHGRNVTVDDIKAQPHMAEKYKLYKKLTKEADVTTKTTQAQVREPPKTPTRAKPKQQAPSNAAPAAILPKSRPVASNADMVSQNPFSPAKKQSNAAGPSTSTSANPFLTPIKARRTRTRTPSPDPFPPVPGPAPALAPAVQRDPAVVKARKRLRGDPVSPSPQPRDKRRRFANGKDIKPHVDDRSTQSRSVSPAPVEEGDSFVDDSPVKAPAGGKAFKPLFEEAGAQLKIPLSQPAAQKGVSAVMRNKAFTRAKTTPGGLFGGAKKDVKDARGGLGLGDGRDIFGGEGAMEVDKNAVTRRGKGKEKEEPVDGTQKVKKKRVLPGPKGLIPGRDDLFEASSPAAAASSSSVQSRDTKTSRKRTLSDIARDESKEERATPNGWNLLPPSPPPKENNGWYNGKGKAKAKGKDTGQRKGKKAKHSPVESDEDMEEDGSSTESADVKMVTWRGRPRSPQPADGDGLALVLDPELQFHLHGRAVDVRARSASPRLEKFEVDLPEEMRRVLALSPRDREKDKEEENLVEGLMKGRRKAGGEIWGPGEIGGEDEGSDEGAAGRAGEEDWEGEGAPWEVAEL